MSAVLWHRSGTRETSDAGAVLPGALAYFFDPSTTTPRTVYTDSALSVPHTHPVEADAYGKWPAVYLPAGEYRYRLTTSAGVTIIDFDGILPSEQVDTDPDAVDADKLLSTGDIIFQLKAGTRTGFVRCNGRTIGNAASGGSERANADTEDLFTYLWDNLSDTICPVSTGRGASAAADYAANKTIGLPDMRGRAPFGLDDMGNSAGSIIASTYVGTGDETTAGSYGGADDHTLTPGEMPVHDHETLSQIRVTSAAAGSLNMLEYEPNVGSGTDTRSTGGGGAHNNMPPFMLGTWFIRL